MTKEELEIRQNKLLRELDIELERLHKKLKERLEEEEKEDGEKTRD